MDARQRNICNNVKNGKLLEESLPQLFNYLADRYQITAQIRLAMHYYTLYESYYDDEGTWNEDILGSINGVNDIIRDYIQGNLRAGEREKAIRKLEGFRGDVTKRVNLLTVYADIFQNFEYVLNRVEYRYNGVNDSVDDMEFSRRILRYIFDTEDNLIINEKIKEMIAQLPIRITKQKYFDLLKDSLGAYLGAEERALDNFLYMIRTSAMLYAEEGMESIYPGLWEKKEYLFGLNYTNLTKEEFDKAQTQLQAVTLYLETGVSIWLSIQEIVNEIYAILLCSPYSGMTGSQQENAEKASISIISDINKIFVTDEKSEISESITLQFEHLEGVQEELTYDIQALESALYEADNEHSSLIKSLMLEQFMNVLKRTQNLLSDSLFVELDMQYDQQSLVDESRLHKEAELLVTELTQLFARLDKMITRAVIANTINKLPVFFNDHKEVMDYVIYSLERCTDPYEKVACTEIIDMIITSNQG